MKSKSTHASATAFAPATVANVGSGFDILGFAVAGIGDLITVTQTQNRGVTIQTVDANIPIDPALNTAGLPLLRMIEALQLDFGFSVQIKKGIPIGSGMGGSAASAVGAVVAANQLLAKKLSREELILYALEGEALASGSKHADNLAPCLYGGLTLSRPGDRPDVVSLPYSKDLFCVLVHPQMKLETQSARALLKKDISLKNHVVQSANLASLIAGFCTHNTDLIRRGLCDVLIEAQRASLISGFYDVQQAALKNGVLGCTISGAGPAVFALATSLEIAQSAKVAMIEAFLKSGGLASQGWISSIYSAGAKIQ